MIEMDTERLSLRLAIASAGRFGTYAATDAWIGARTCLGCAHSIAPPYR